MNTEDGCILDLKSVESKVVVSDGWKSLAKSRGRAFGGLLGDNPLKLGSEGRAELPEAKQFLLSDNQF